MARSNPETQNDLGAEQEHRSEKILSDVRDLYQILQIQKDPPRRIVWSRMVPHWGPVDFGEPVILGREVFIHRDLGSLTSDELKPLIASSLTRSRKTGKHARAVGLLIVGLLFSILVASFILLPLLLPQPVLLTCRTCTTGYGPLGDAITLYVEPILLIFAGIFLLRAYSRNVTYKADREVAATLGRNQLIASLNAVLASITEPPATSRRATDRRIRRSLRSVRGRIRVLESTPS